MTGNKSPSRASRFIERTIEGTISFLKETVSHDELALPSRGRLLQSLDARFKLLSVALLLAGALFTRSRAELALLCCACTLAAALSGIPLRFYLKRTLLFIPLFSLFIILPSIFSFVTPGDPLVTVPLFGYTLSVTQQGLAVAALFLLRVTASVSLAVLLVLTTPHHLLLKTLRVFRVPNLFVMTLGMCYRYIYLLLDIVQNSFVALKSRVGFVASTAAGRRIVAQNMAGLWLRSYRLHMQVFDAMMARGFTGEPMTAHRFRSQPADFLLVLLSLSFLLGTLWLNRSLQ